MPKRHSSESDAAHAEEAEKLYFLRLEELDIECLNAEQLAGLQGQRPDLQDELARVHDALVEVEAIIGAAVDDPQFPFEEIRRLRQRDPESRYRLKGEIARGGQGVIVRVWDQMLGRALAMKVVAGSQGDSESLSGASSKWDSRAVRRFLAEARITGILDHPSVVPVHELGVDANGGVFFTMKLVRGESLAQVIARHKGDRSIAFLSRIAEILRRVSEALAYAHSKGVVHRDVKPSNIMVGEYGEVYLMDWGLAKVTERETSVTEAPEYGGIGLGAEGPRTIAGSVLGTPAYMPPEQASGSSALVGPKVDVYGVGACLYEAVQGFAPYSGSGSPQDPLEVVRQVIEGAPRALPTDLDRGLSPLLSICRKAMSREIELRYTDARELVEELRAYLEGRVVGAHESGVYAEVRRWIARNRKLATAALASVLALTALAGSWIRSEWQAAQIRAQRQALVTIDRAILAGESLLRVATDLEYSAGLSRPRRSELERELDRVLSEEGVWEDAQLPGFSWNVVQESDLLVAATRDGSQTEQLRNFVSGIESILSGEGLSGADREFYQLELSLFETLHRRSVASELIANEAPLESAGGSPAGVDQGEIAFESEQQSRRYRLRVLSSLLKDPVLGWGRTAGFRLGAHERFFPDGSAWASSLDWAEAIDAIRSSDRYGELELLPDKALRSLGENPRSGLWEFLLLGSGEVPDRREDGEFHMKGDSGIIFTLIPGGEVTVGTQWEERFGDRYDPNSQSRERPVQDLGGVDAFYMAKYELTQGQWIRLTGTQPSESYSAHDTRSTDPITRAHPVELVSWVEARSAISFWGLQLPTEAQWDHAARGGEPLPYLSHEMLRALPGGVNCLDASYERVLKGAAEGEPAVFDDGFVYHEPVGRREPNGFGLHNVLGNVSEWCWDYFAEDYSDFWIGEVEAPDLRFNPPLSLHRTVRGGSFARRPEFCRVSCRERLRPTDREWDIGVRPVRLALTRR